MLGGGTRKADHDIHVFEVDFRKLREMRSEML